MALAVEAREAFLLPLGRLCSLLVPRHETHPKVHREEQAGPACTTDSRKLLATAFKVEFRSRRLITGLW